MLNIDLEFIKGVLFIRLKGVLDNKTCIKLDDCLYDMIFEKEMKYFAINLSELKFIDSTGLKTIINRYFDIVLNDGKMIICGYNRQLRNNTKLKKVFNSIDHTNSEEKVIDLINV